MTELIETTDPELAEHILSASYQKMRIDAHGRRGGIRLVQQSLTPQVRFDDLRFGLNLEFAGPPLGVVNVGHLRKGSAAYDSGDGERRYRPGDVFLPVDPYRPFTAVVDRTEVEVAVIDPALLSQIAATEPGRTQRPVRLTGYEPVSPQAAQAWESTYAYIRDTVLANPGAAAQPLLASGAVRLLVAATLATFPNDALTDPTSEDRHDGHPRTLSRAVAYIDEHAHQDITPADIAEAASVTIRAVQLAFRRHMDTSPMHYVRRVRLVHAHHDLLAAERAGRAETVTAVAYRWGFSSPSRFAGYYRRTYGVSPSHTLGQDRPA